MKSRRYLYLAIAGQLLMVVALGLQGCDESTTSTETTTKVEAPAEGEAKKDPKWTPAGTLREVTLITIEEKVYSRVETTEGSYFVEGFVSGRRGDECQTSDTGWLDIKGNLNYYTILGL